MCSAAGNHEGNSKMRKKRKSDGPQPPRRRYQSDMEYLAASLADGAGADAVHYLCLLDYALANNKTYIAESTGIKREDLFERLARRGKLGINSLKPVTDRIGLKLPADWDATEARRIVAACIRDFHRHLHSAFPSHGHQSQGPP